MPTLEEVLRNLKLGSRVAEDEADTLANYFVETDQFRRLMQGEVDVVFGPKGAGKSAIYSALLGRDDDMFDARVTLVAGEIPRGTPAFRDVVADPPTSEKEFTAIWKFYILSLVSGVLDDFDIKGGSAEKVRAALAAEGLSQGPGGLRGLVQRVRGYVGRLLRPESVEGELKIDPLTGVPVGVVGRITLGEPSADARRAGYVSADGLLQMTNEALRDAGFEVWVLFDRLDVAFAENQNLEANALRSLFRVYLDMLGFAAVKLKIFLRSDIWRTITNEGFREASHITRTVAISWDEQTLLNLVVRRLISNDHLVDFSSVDRDAVIADAREQRVWFDSLVPDQIDSGRNPKTFEWIIGRVKDGQGIVAPREVIHLMDQAREFQIAALERGDSPAEGGAIFGRAAFRDALPAVSKVRLEQTIFAEYPALKPYIEKLTSQKTNQSEVTLAALWQLSREETQAVATRLVEIGFFEARGSRSDPDYWVPFLYRPALQMVQGTAE